MNAFTDYYSQKDKLKSLAQTACDYEIINPQLRDSICDKIDSDILTIGVIGQVKAGKSTFLNSFIFEDSILPVAGSPMTSSLCVIKYGTEKQIEVEFYSTEEWTELQIQSNRNPDDIMKESERSKVKAAKEIIKNSVILEQNININELLGTKKKDTLDRLVDYVGRNGKFLPITKSVTIYYPNDSLKGVEIVDTPGLNDPIESREIKTKDFLKNADVVILMLYAGQAFTSEDYDILFKHVRSCGIGKVLIGVNKYDIPFGNGDLLDDIKNRIIQEINEGCRNCADPSLNYVLQDCEPVLFSAQMALLSELSIEKIQGDNDFSSSWKRFSELFEISTFKEFRELSHIDVLIEKVKSTIETEKNDILLKSPANTILTKANQKLLDIQSEITELNNKINIFSIPDTQLNNKLLNFRRGLADMTTSLDLIEINLQEECDRIQREARRKVERCIDATCVNLRHIIDNWGITQDIDVIQPRIMSEINRLFYRDLKRCTEDIINDAKRDVKNEIDILFQSIDSIGVQYLPDFKLKEHLVNIQKNISIEIDNDLFIKTDTDSQDGFFSKVLNILGDISRIINPIGDKISNAITHNKIAKDCLEYINQLEVLDTSLYTYTLTDGINSILSMIHTYCKEKLINPINSSILEVESHISERDELLSNAMGKKEEKENELKTIKEQLENLNNIIQ